MNKFISYILGLGTFTYINIVGYISFAELLIIVLAPIVILSNYKLLFAKEIKIVILLGILWLASSITTDLIRETEIALMFKGIAKVVFLIVSLTVFYILFQIDRSNFKWYFAGAALSGIIGLYYFKSGDAIVKDILYGSTDDFLDPLNWRRNITHALNTILFATCALCYSRIPKICILLILSLGIINIVFGSRAAGGIQIMSALTVLYFYYSKTKRLSNINLLSIKTIFTFIFIITSVVGVYFGYTLLASSGSLGEEQRNRFEEQSNERLGLLLGGRIELFAGLLAVKDSPIIGHGSWAQDNNGYFIDAITITEFDTKGASLAQIEQNRIPSHSHILEAWVEHGLLGAIFWIYIYTLVLVILSGQIRTNPKMIGLLALISWFLLWHIMFSPIGNRVWLGAIISVILLTRLDYRMITGRLSNINKKLVT